MVKKRIRITALMMSVALVFTGCKSSVYENSKSDYTPVTTVKAANFEVPSNLLLEATAISSISKSEEYNGMYVYKDGESKYILFNTKSIVVACGPTEFNFKGNENEETLASKSVEGVWMSSDSFDYSSDDSDGIYKIIVNDVTAEFALTPTQYCNMKGYFASVTDGSTEYSIFAGAVTDDDMTKDQETILKHIVKSFKFDTEGAEEISNESKAEDEKEDTPEDNPSNEAVEVTESNSDALSAETINEDVSEPSDTENDDTKDELEEDLDVSVEANLEEDSSEGNEDDSTEEASQDKTGEAADEKEDIQDETSEETEADEITEESSTDENDDFETAVEDDTWEVVELKPVESTVYKPLSVGKWGIASGYDVDGNPITIDVRVDNIITGDDAKTLIKQYKGKYKQPKEGTSFVVVEYSTNVSAENGYVDLRFCGVDGERLKLRGISYTTRSYDLYNSEELGTQYDVPTFTHRYAYYEVPTGCKEYMLVFGLHCNSLPDSPTANYLIKLD